MTQRVNPGRPYLTNRSSRHERLNVQRNFKKGVFSRAEKLPSDGRDPFQVWHKHILLLLKSKELNVSHSAAKAA